LGRGLVLSFVVADAVDIIGAAAVDIKWSLLLLTLLLLLPPPPPPPPLSISPPNALRFEV
jgi:hypothetical protein